MSPVRNFDVAGSKKDISNGVRYIVPLLVLAIILVADNICFGSEAMLQRAWACYLKGDYRKAVDTCRIISRDRILGEEGRYIMGLSLLKLGNFQEARKNFNFVLDNYLKSKMKEELLLGVGDSYYLEGRFDKAEEYYVRLLRNFSATGYASMAYLRLGESQKKQGKWEKAEYSFNKVVRDYPLSLEKKAAESFLQSKRSFFTAQVGAFTKRGNAQNLYRLLRRRGYDAYIDKVYERDRLIYKVRVGNFSTKKQAQREAVKLKRDGFTARVCT